MAGTNINRVIITGNLTKDPEMRATGGGMSVCNLRIATNSSRKDNNTGEWVDVPNYFSVTIFGRQGETAAQYLSKGRGVAVDGRLSWREYTDKDGNKREAIEIVADRVQFLNGGEGGGGGNYNGGGSSFTPRSDVPVSTDDFAPVGNSGGGYGGGSTSAADDDIPF
jgi:single-strand DNA-binding protein